MGKVNFLKGPALMSLARKKAAGLGLDGKGLKLAELVRMVQEKEGHASCFKREKLCSHVDCCWQASCGAKLEKQEVRSV
ncbi:MAG: hypothetical protein KKD01_15595 [Proteobacteria bacterium]|nr:hypothetical protein [Pseudomonadota bacterium]MBU1456148.1 hypothetical protein [Pseudomonadota bacterium]